MAMADGAMPATATLSGQQERGCQGDKATAVPGQGLRFFGNDIDLLRKLIDCRLP